MGNTQNQFAPLYLTELITLFQVYYLHRPHTLDFTLNSSEFVIFTEKIVQFGG